MAASLYFHIPFCAGACWYCDFYSLAVDPEDPRLDALVDRLLADMEEALGRYAVESVPSVYIGGGTPSMLGKTRLDRLLAGIQTQLPGRAAEFTLEANPESLTEEALDCCLRRGVTRISLGVQSLDDACRRSVGRYGETPRVAAALELVSRSYPEAFSVDLMSGLPLQTEAILRRDIQQVLSYGPSHVSLYDLSLEEGTPLFHRVNAGSVDMPTEQEAETLWIAGRDTLVDSGYEHYEVSNFARPGKRCLHNMRYWLMEDWLAFGPGASGTIRDGDRATRTRIPSDADSYLSSGPKAEIELLDRSATMAETLMMGFRLSDGPDPDRFLARYGLALESCVPTTLHAWRSRGLVDPDRPRLNGEGLLLLNPFLVDCISELESTGFLPVQGASGAGPYDVRYDVSLR